LLKRSASSVTGESAEDSPPESGPGRLMRMLSTVAGGSPSGKSSPPKKEKLPSPGRLTKMFQNLGKKQIAVNNMEKGDGKNKAANAFAAAINEAAKMDVDEMKPDSEGPQDEETKRKSMLMMMKSRLDKSGI
jgi:hypothetical protein